MNRETSQKSSVFNAPKVSTANLAPARENAKEAAAGALRPTKLGIAGLSVYYGKFRALAGISMEIPEH